MDAPEEPQRKMVRTRPPGRVMSFDPFCILVYTAIALAVVIQGALILWMSL